MVKHLPDLRRIALFLAIFSIVYFLISLNQTRTFLELFGYWLVVAGVPLSILALIGFGIYKLVKGKKISY